MRVCPADTLDAFPGQPEAADLLSHKDKTVLLPLFPSSLQEAPFRVNLVGCAFEPGPSSGLCHFPPLLLNFPRPAARSSHTGAPPEASPCLLLGPLSCGSPAFPASLHAQPLRASDLLQKPLWSLARAPDRQSSEHWQKLDQNKPLRQLGSKQHGMAAWLWTFRLNVEVTCQGGRENGVLARQSELVKGWSVMKEQSFYPPPPPPPPPPPLPSPLCRPPP